MTSDPQVTDMIDQHPGGVDGLLDDIFEGMRSIFRPAAAIGQEGRFRYDIVHAGTVRSYSVVVAEEKCDIGRGDGDAGPVDLSVSLDLAVFLRLVTGELDIIRAFVAGDIEMSGNMLYFAKFERWFAAQDEAA
ncbi:SCP2 sterol-binding domain-containing protein [Actinomadura sp. KC216]|uniref:SCP2 sterol-binding domain-containing protein n=1 Tax=Actinomadura sp. KC216 TaxID=2530370 RepID=UPI0014052A46|nr:SCP2 sterol-binding domain-containing protein [Actinomadura sp. KC216]